MFIPKLFQFPDKADMIAFMKQYSFATIITVKDDLPIATQLPFFIDERDETLVLCSHFALANEQAQYIESVTSLVIFSQPHAYISPTHYDKRESVPTWDYISVHAYGKATILPDEANKRQSLEQTIRFCEPAYLEQWNSLSDTYKKRMMQGIVAFELAITDLQGQKKLSQNKTDEERTRIVNHLETSDNGAERDLAPYIRTL
jgi:transcriptional regulator